MKGILMNRFLEALLLASAIFLLPPLVSAQTTISITGNNVGKTVDSDVAAKAISFIPPTGTLTKQVAVLRDRKSFLEKRLAALSPTSADYLLVTDWVRELGEKIEELKHEQNAIGSSVPSTEPEDASTSSVAIAASVARTDEATPSLQPQTRPDFKLSRPVSGATNEDPELLLAWTEDKQSNKTYKLTKFIVEIASSERREANGRFSRAILVKEVAPSGVLGQSIKVPRETLRGGEKYYWQVLAEFIPQGSSLPDLKTASNAPESFKTLAQTFEAFEHRGLALQRAVAGPDATEGAQFGFLKTFNEGTVYTADFALIYSKRLRPTQRTSTAFQASVRGNLTSAESESDDALQFRAGAIIDRNLKRNTINHLFSSLAAKYETDQNFRVGKIISENMFTPTIPSLGIGVPFGRPSNPVQFRWRPFFYFDIGRSFKKGNSMELEDSVLRLTPRVRTTLTLNFLRRALNLNDTFIFADDFFYFLPLEKAKSRYNMFTSGFVLQMTKDFGFGLTYKSGEAAPKFRPVHTFSGVLTIRFGKEE
jgi:hypothetical protein